MKKPLLYTTGALIVLSSMLIGSMSAARGSKKAKAHCFCVIDIDRGPEIKSFSNPLANLGQIKEYTGVFPQKDDNQKDCERVCSDMVNNDPTFNNPDLLCKKIGRDFNGTIRGYAAVGTRNYRVCQTKNLRCKVEIKCPDGWIADGNGPAGKRCKKVSTCKFARPCPPDGSAIMNGNSGQAWGFVWDCVGWQWGASTENVVSY